MVFNLGEMSPASRLMRVQGASSTKCSSLSGVPACHGPWPESEVPLPLRVRCRQSTKRRVRSIDPHSPASAHFPPSDAAKPTHNGALVQNLIGEPSSPLSISVHCGLSCNQSRNPESSVDEITPGTARHGTGQNGPPRPVDKEQQTAHRARQSADRASPKFQARVIVAASGRASV